MNIDNLTIKEAKDLVSMFSNIEVQRTTPCEFIGRYVVVRTYSAGVHVGVLKSRNGQEVVLTEAKRIWQWQGANTLHEIGLSGVDKASKVSDETPSIILTQVIEIIPASKDGEKCLRSRGWSK